MDQSSPQAAKFEEGEKILAHHQNMIYEARVMKVEVRPDPARKLEGKRKPFYQIHYQGWNDRWDEWVDDTRLLKDNEENREVQRVMREEYTRRAAKKKDKKDVNKPSKKRRLEGDPLERDELGGAIHKVEVNVPLSLKKKLIDDWSNIANEKNLVPLPRNPTVSQILIEYVSAKGSNPSNENEFDAIVEGIKAYFDKALGSLLLYKFERQQYGEILKNFPQKRMCDVYGVEHLLRLFVKLPDLIATTEMEEETVISLTEGVKDILKYINKNIGTLFLSEYNAATPVYIRMATT